MPPAEVVDKLSLYSGVAKEAIVLLPNADSIYEVPLTLEDNGIGAVLAKRLGLETHKPDLKDWREFVDRAIHRQTKRVSVGVVAKYLNNQDTYMSVFEALKAAAWNEGVGVDIHWVNAEKIEAADLGQYDGIVVPGGFGNRGVEGKISAAEYALKNKLPYLGLCLGMQVGVIAAARLSGIKDATSLELDPDAKNPVIAAMDDQKGKENTGGTMRLGDYPCDLISGTLASKVYGQKSIIERHRHRYEANNDFTAQYEKWGIIASGKSPDGKLVEVIEAKDHPFFLASQFHPEFKSRPNRPHPMFTGFVKSLK
jgi:CTP synthase